VAEDHVLFSVTSMEKLPNVPRYGSLARRSLDEMLAGARVDVAPYKRDPMDFVLWKPSKDGLPGWPSPGGIEGLGRPGWHIECSAMAWKHLIKAFDTRIKCDDADRNVFDIHGGGIDLVFPHHENEIAQSCCAFETEQMAKIWMHNGFLQVEGEKMSKSLGNFITISELLETEKFGGRRWPGEVLRLAMLKTHYRQPIDWTVRALEEAEANLLAWHGAEGIAETGDAAAPSTAVLDSFADDLNAAEAIVALHRLRKAGDVEALAANLRFLGLFNPGVFAREEGAVAVAPEVRERVEALIAARREARAGKAWAESDRIRDELVAMGVTLKDNKDGTTTWEVSR